MKKPVPEDFGLTTREYGWIIENLKPWLRTTYVTIIVISIVIGMCAALFISDESDRIETGIGLGWLSSNSLRCFTIMSFLYTGILTNPYRCRLRHSI